MTRFARASGSKASNERKEEEATPWHVMRQQLADQLSNSNSNRNANILYNYKSILNNDQDSKKEVWSEFNELKGNSDNKSQKIINQTNNLEGETKTHKKEKQQNKLKRSKKDNSNTIIQTIDKSNEPIELQTKSAKLIMDDIKYEESEGKINHTKAVSKKKELVKSCNKLEHLKHKKHNYVKFENQYNVEKDNCDPETIYTQHHNSEQLQSYRNSLVRKSHEFSELKGNGDNSSQKIIKQTNNLEGERKTHKKEKQQNKLKGSKEHYNNTIIQTIDKSNEPIPLKTKSAELIPDNVKDEESEGINIDHTKVKSKKKKLAKSCNKLENVKHKKHNYVTFENQHNVEQNNFDLENECTQNHNSEQLQPYKNSLVSKPHSDITNKPLCPSSSDKSQKNKTYRFSCNNNYNNLHTIIANGREIKVVSFEGFLIKNDDAIKLKKLRKKLRTQNIPKEQIKDIMKLERRKAEKALSREKKNVCFHCRRFGHNFTDCPDIKDTEMSKSGMCFKCGSMEHSHFQCKVLQGQDFRYAVCFICKEQGHIARQCSLNPQGQYPKGGSCHLCGEVTHLRKDCPKAVVEKPSCTAEKLMNIQLEEISDMTSGTAKPGIKNKIVVF